MVIRTQNGLRYIGRKKITLCTARLSTVKRRCNFSALYVGFTWIITEAGSTAVWVTLTQIIFQAPQRCTVANNLKLLNEVSSLALWSSCAELLPERKICFTWVEKHTVTNTYFCNLHTKKGSQTYECPVVQNGQWAASFFGQHFNFGMSYFTWKSKEKKKLYFAWNFLLNSLK